MSTPTRLRPSRSAPRLLVTAVLAAAAWGCADAGRSEGGDDRAYDLDPQLVFWEELQELCGQAFPGRVVSSVPPDSVFEAGPVVAWVRSCDVAEVRIPVAVGSDRSRTWVVSPTAVGLRLRHVHRHEDGAEDEISGYGGETLGPGSETVQEFHADDYTAGLVPEAAGNVWTLEIHPDSLMVYALRREGSERRFRLELDLSRTVPPPSPPAGGSR